MKDPIHPTEAKQLIRAILSEGFVTYSRHALEEMKKDDMTAVDVINVLRGGTLEAGELENGSWRYRSRTSRMAVVVTFRTETELRIVTAWRFTS